MPEPRWGSRSAVGLRARCKATGRGMRGRWSGEGNSCCVLRARVRPPTPPHNHPGLRCSPGCFLDVTAFSPTPRFRPPSCVGVGPVPRAHPTSHPRAGHDAAGPPTGAHGERWPPTPEPAKPALANMTHLSSRQLRSEPRACLQPGLRSSPVCHVCSRARCAHRVRSAPHVATQTQSKRQAARIPVPKIPSHEGALRARCGHCARSTSVGGLSSCADTGSWGSSPFTKLRKAACSSSATQRCCAAAPPESGRSG